MLIAKPSPSFVILDSLTTAYGLFRTDSHHGRNEGEWADNLFIEDGRVSVSLCPFGMSLIGLSSHHHGLCLCSSCIGDESEFLLEFSFGKVLTVQHTYSRLTLSVSNAFAP